MQHAESSPSLLDATARGTTQPGSMWLWDVGPLQYQADDDIARSSTKAMTTRGDAADDDNMYLRPDHHRRSGRLSVSFGFSFDGPRESIVDASVASDNEDDELCSVSGDEQHPTPRDESLTGFGMSLSADDATTAALAIKSGATSSPSSVSPPPPTAESERLSSFYSRMVLSYRDAVEKGSVVLQHSGFDVHTVPQHRQGDASMYEDENLKKRAAVQVDLRMTELLESVWQSMPKRQLPPPPAANKQTPLSPSLGSGGGSGDVPPKKSPVSRSLSPMTPTSRTGRSPSATAASITTGDGYVTFNVFRAMSAYVFRRLVPEGDVEEFLHHCKADWTEFASPSAALASSSGATLPSPSLPSPSKNSRLHQWLMNKAQFFHAMFSIADVWTTSAEPEEYFTFVKRVLQPQANKISLIDPNVYFDVRKNVFAKGAYRKRRKRASSTAGASAPAPAQAARSPRPSPSIQPVPPPALPATLVLEDNSLGKETMRDRLKDALSTQQLNVFCIEDDTKHLHGPVVSTTALTVRHRLQNLMLPATRRINTVLQKKATKLQSTKFTVFASHDGEHIEVDESDLPNAASASHPSSGPSSPTSPTSTASVDSGTKTIAPLVHVHIAVQSVAHTQCRLYDNPLHASDDDDDEEPAKVLHPEELVAALRMPMQRNAATHDGVPSKKPTQLSALCIVDDELLDSDARYAPSLLTFTSREGEHVTVAPYTRMDEALDLVMLESTKIFNKCFEYAEANDNDDENGWASGKHGEEGDDATTVADKENHLPHLPGQEETDNDHQYVTEALLQDAIRAISVPIAHATSGADDEDNIRKKQSADANDAAAAAAAAATLEQNGKLKKKGSCGALIAPQPPNIDSMETAKRSLLHQQRRESLMMTKSSPEGQGRLVLPTTMTHKLIKGRKFCAGGSRSRREEDGGAHASLQQASAHPSLGGPLHHSSKGYALPAFPFEVGQSPFVAKNRFFRQECGEVISRDVLHEALERRRREEEDVAVALPQQNGGESTDPSRVVSGFRPTRTPESAATTSSRDAAMLTGKPFGRSPSAAYRFATGTTNSRLGLEPDGVRGVLPPGALRQIKTVVPRIVPMTKAGKIIVVEPAEPLPLHSHLNPKGSIPSAHRGPGKHPVSLKVYQPYDRAYVDHLLVGPMLAYDATSVIRHQFTNANNRGEDGGHHVGSAGEALEMVVCSNPEKYVKSLAGLAKVAVEARSNDHAFLALPPVFREVLRRAEEDPFSLDAVDPEDLLKLSVAAAKGSQTVALLKGAHDPPLMIKDRSDNDETGVHLPMLVNSKQRVDGLPPQLPAVDGPAWDQQFANVVASGPPNHRLTHEPRVPPRNHQDKRPARRKPVSELVSTSHEQRDRGSLLFGAATVAVPSLPDYTHPTRTILDQPERFSVRSMTCVEGRDVAPSKILKDMQEKMFQQNGLTTEAHAVSTTGHYSPHYTRDAEVPQEEGGLHHATATALLVTSAVKSAAAPSRLVKRQH